RRSKKPAQIRGVILLVVLSLLTLFAVVGISFVLYADAEAESSRIFKEAAANPSNPDMDPEQAFAFIMGQLVYPVPNDSGTGSGFRGHELSRGAYGWFNDEFTAGSFAPNDKPYSGPGRLHTQQSIFNTPGFKV